MLRTGFGIYHRTATQIGQTDGYSQATGYMRSLDGDITPSAGLTGPYSLQNPFPDGIIAPGGRELGLLTSIGNAVSYDARQRPIPRTFQYSFGFQRRAFWNILLDVSYVGSITTHDAIADQYRLLVLRVQPGCAGAAGLRRHHRPQSVLRHRARQPHSGRGSTIRRRELYRTYPLFANVTNNIMPWARYRYDALQLRADKRFTSDRSVLGGLTMVFSYTFSKNFQEANYLNNWNYDHEKPVKELVSYDKPQNISFSGVWDVPFGRGRHFAAHTEQGGWRHHRRLEDELGLPLHFRQPHRRHQRREQLRLPAGGGPDARPLVEQRQGLLERQSELLAPQRGGPLRLAAADG